MTTDSSEKPSALRRAWSTRYAALGNLLPALTIAAATVFFEQIPLFAPVDIATRALMSVIRSGQVEARLEELRRQGFQPSWHPDPEDERPLVLIVPDLPAQANARGLSPGQFAADLVAAAAAKGPAVLAVSFDSLDPQVDDWRLNDPACDYLQRANLSPARLDPSGACHRPEDVEDVTTRMRVDVDGRTRFHNALVDAGAATRVVVKSLYVPTSVAEYDEVASSNNGIGKRLLVRRMLSTRDLCRSSRVRVAWDIAPTTSFLYDRRAPTLGNVVWAARQEGKPQGNLHLAGHRLATEDGCAPFKQAGQFIEVGLGSSLTDVRRELRTVVARMALQDDAPAFGSLETLNPRYFESLANGLYIYENSAPPDSPVGDLIPEGLTGHVVFLGDDTARADVLQWRGAPEVAFNAAVYYSNVLGVVGLRHAVAFAIDVVLGAALGWLFMTCWNSYAAAQSRLNAMPAASIWGMVTRIPAYLRSRAILVFNLALLGALTVVMFLVAHWLLREGVWINPLPLVIGMSIKGLLASRHAGAQHTAHDWWGFYNQHPDAPVQLLLVAVFIGSLFLAGH